MFKDFNVEEYDKIFEKTFEILNKNFGKFIS
jgi:hypothetical protein